MTMVMITWFMAMTREVGTKALLKFISHARLKPLEVMLVKSCLIVGVGACKLYYFTLRCPLFV